MDRGKCLTFYSLRALSSADMLLLISAFMQQVVPIYYMHSGCSYDRVFCKYRGFFQIYMWPLICIAQMSSVWMTVLISGERYLAICHPLRSMHMRSISKVRWATIVIYCASILFNIPKFFEFQPELVHDADWNITIWAVGATDMRANLIYRYLYNTALFCLLVYAIPLIILTYLNVKIIAQMRAANKGWDTLNRRQQHEVKATVMPLCTVLVFIMCTTQSLLAFVFDAIYSDISMKWLQIYTAVVNLIVIFNAAVNFLIFYLFGRKFRVLLKKFLHCDFRVESRMSFHRWRFQKHSSTDGWCSFRSADMTAEHSTV